jgi:hypothetical protein
MPPSLHSLRQAAPAVVPSQFLRWQPGSFIQYFDDTPAKDPAKALSARTFDPLVCARKQREHCAVCFSLQAFGESRTKGHLLCYRSLGVDVDLIPAPERDTAKTEAIDRRKDAYLQALLLRFPLRPHWLIETGRGFHVVIRVQPQREPEGVNAAEALGRRLVGALRGDRNATLLTQLLRVPGTYQFKDPAHPFLCRLLLDNAKTIPPFTLGTVRNALDVWERMHGVAPDAQTSAVSRMIVPASRWRSGLGGVPPGERNATAASLAGKILCRLPEELWETAAWGGLREWNRRNVIPLPERELRAVFESIARRERSNPRSRASSPFPHPSHDPPQ